MKEYKIINTEDINLFPPKKGFFADHSFETKIERIEQVLNEHSESGWRLVSAAPYFNLDIFQGLVVFLERDKQ